MITGGGGQNFQLVSFLASKILELDDYGGRGTKLPTSKLFSSPFYPKNSYLKHFNV